MLARRSNFKRYFKVAAYLGRFTRETVVIAMGIPSLKARTLAAVLPLHLSSRC